MPARIDQWITIRDWSAGIKGRSTPANNTRHAAESLTFAAPDGTYACHALPDGSLGPLPRSTASLALTSGDLPIAPTATENGRLAISGYHRAGPIQTGDEAHIAFEWVNDGGVNDGKRGWAWRRIRTFLANQVDAIRTIAPTSESAPVTPYFRPTYFDSYRAATSDPTTSGLPVVAAGWFAGSGGGAGDDTWHLFPDPDTPTTDSVQSISDSVAPGPMLSHQGRSVAFHNAAAAHGANSYVWPHNEDLYFTNANLYTLQNAVGSPQTLGAENASGYMAAVSANHQELLAVKLVGGGILIRGDLADPTVLRLPGIPSVTRHIPVVCPAGIILLDAIQTGAWLWTGGETAENISADALDGERFDMGRQGGTGGEGQQGTDFLDFTGKLVHWYDWVVFPNNWIWNWKTGAWWRLSDPSTVRFFQGAVSIHSNPQLHLVPAYIDATSDPVSYQFSYTTPATTYEYQSQPVPIGENSRNYKIRELVVVATGIGDVTLTLTRRDGTTSTHGPFSFTTVSRPQFFRDNVDVECQAILYKIVVNNVTGNSTPVVHELRFGVQEDTHYPARTA